MAVNGVKIGTLPPDSSKGDPYTRLRMCAMISQTFYQKPTKRTPWRTNKAIDPSKQIDYQFVR